MTDVTVRQVRSANRSSVRQRETLRSLKLGRIGSTATHADTPQLRGMLRVVEHLVDSPDSASRPRRSKGDGKKSR